MTDQDHPSPSLDDPIPGGTDSCDDPRSEAVQDGGAAPGPVGTVTIPATELETLRRNLQELKDMQMRTQAEFENVKRRLRKDAEESGTRAVVRFVRPILIEIDNLERALASASPESHADFAKGVAMIRANLDAALAAAGIEPVQSAGIFDPGVHEAIAEVERSDLPKGTIVDVHRHGYRLGGQLVRGAQVVVSRPAVPTTPSPSPTPSTQGGHGADPTGT